MNSKSSDILQIKKYLEGKLDTRAMYELERRALDDPFLLDAIEGYAAAGNQDQITADLANKLQHRLQKPKGRVISLSVLAMAASVIAVLTVGGWWLFSRPEVNKKLVAQKIETDHTSVTPSPLANQPQISINKDSLIASNTKSRSVITAPRQKYYNQSQTNNQGVEVTSDETAEIASSVMRENSLLDESPALASARARRDSVPFNEMVVMGMAAQRKKAASDEALKEQTFSAPRAASTTVLSRTVKGKVVSDDGQPIPGVAVKAGNSPNATFTDKDGAYTLNIDSLNTDITYRYIGYRTRKIDAKDGIANVVLEPDNASLNEVVIAGYGNAKPADAAPKYGWENFQRYLNANSVLPNGKSGSSKVSFTVEKDGSLSNFQINKADNEMAGQKAIQLIKNGPEWVGSPQGKPKKITVTVKFHKPEKQ